MCVKDIVGGEWRAIIRRRELLAGPFPVAANRLVPNFGLHDRDPLAFGWGP